MDTALHFDPWHNAQTAVHFALCKGSEATKLGRTVYLTFPTNHQAQRLRSPTLLHSPRKSVSLLSGHTLYLCPCYTSRLANSAYTCTWAPQHCCLITIISMLWLFKFSSLLIVTQQQLIIMYLTTNFTHWSSLHGFGADHTENIAYNSCSNVACIFVAVETRLPYYCLATTTSSCSINPAFSRHVTI
jgi:hypothetical protein